MKIKINLFKILTIKVTKLILIIINLFRIVKYKKIVWVIIVSAIKIQILLEMNRFKWVNIIILIFTKYSNYQSKSI